MNEYGRLERLEGEFQSHIFSRGEKLAFTDAVQIEIDTEELLTASVKGTEEYEVSIQYYEGSDEYEMYCSCPYAASERNCKHMVAALIASANNSGALEDYKDKNGGHLLPLLKMEVEYNKNYREIMQWLEQVEQRELFDFIARKMSLNKEMTKDFLRRFPLRELNSKYMLREYDELRRSYLGRDRFIDYNHAWSFSCDLCDYLVDVESLVKSERAVEAAEIIAYISKGFDQIPMDDSDGGTTMFYESLIKVVNKILEVNDEDANKVLLEWVESVMLDNNDWYLQEYVNPLWERLLDSKEFEQRKIEFLKTKLNNYPNDVEERVQDYTFVRELLELVNLLEKSADSIDEIKSILEPYKAADRITSYLIEKAKMIEDKKEEETLIIYGIEQAIKHHHWRMENDFREKLCDFYKMNGTFEKYCKVLRQLVMDSNSELKRYREYKNLFDEKGWSKEGPKLIRDMRSRFSLNRVMPRVYVEEEMWEDLFEYLKKNSSLDILYYYKEYLPDIYDERLLELFLASLDKLASYSGTQGHYREIVDWMMKIRVLLGGKTAITEKEQYYRVKYKRRRNFIAELDKESW